MRLIKIIIGVLLIGLLASCSTIKALQYIKMGSVSERNFYVELPFEIRYGLIIVKVKIHGKVYDFLLDTGAPNVLSTQVAKQLGIKAAGNGKAGDSQGQRATLQFAVLDSIGIGDLQFLNTGVAIADLQQSKEIACFKLDGLLGANLMRKAVWQFDYQRKIITITNKRDSLFIPKNAIWLNFHPNRVYTPLLDVQLNGITDANVEVDLGSNGDFCSSMKTYNALNEKGLPQQTYSYGYGASGLFGRGNQDTIRYAQIATIGIDSLQLTNQMVYFIKSGVKTIGNNFFKNYTLIIDWSDNKLIMIPETPYNNLNQKEFKFSVVLKDNQVFIGSVYAVPNKATDGPQLGDRVLEIDGKDYRNCSGEDWCKLLSSRYEHGLGHVTIRVKRGEKEMEFTVAKESIFKTN
jgi:predicted aspartyl protease